MSQEQHSSRPPLIQNPAFRKIIRQTLILTSLMVAAMAVSSAVNFYLNVWPVHQRLQKVKEEANTFRLSSNEDVARDIDPTIGWDQLVRGEGRGKTVQLRGKVGLHHQVYSGAPGGTFFLFPPDAPSGQGDRVLVYFGEREPPEEGAQVEFVAKVTQLDAMDIATQINPQRAKLIEQSVPRAILIARPITTLPSSPAMPAGSEPSP